MFRERLARDLHKRSSQDRPHRRKLAAANGPDPARNARGNNREADAAQSAGRFVRPWSLEAVRFQPKKPASLPISRGIRPVWHDAEFPAIPPTAPTLHD